MVCEFGIFTTRIGDLIMRNVCPNAYVYVSWSVFVSVSACAVGCVRTNVCEHEQTRVGVRVYVCVCV